MRNPGENAAGRAPGRRQGPSARVSPPEERPEAGQQTPARRRDRCSRPATPAGGPGPRPRPRPGRRAVRAGQRRGQGPGPRLPPGARSAPAAVPARPVLRLEPDAGGGRQRLRPGRERYLARRRLRRARRGRLPGAGRPGRATPTLATGFPEPGLDDPGYSAGRHGRGARQTGRTTPARYRAGLPRARLPGEPRTPVRSRATRRPRPATQPPMPRPRRPGRPRATSRPPPATGRTSARRASAGRARRAPGRHAARLRPFRRLARHQPAGSRGQPGPG